MNGIFTYRNLTVTLKEQESKSSSQTCKQWVGESASVFMTLLHAPSLACPCPPPLPVRLPDWQRLSAGGPVFRQRQQARQQLQQQRPCSLRGGSAQKKYNTKVQATCSRSAPAVQGHMTERNPPEHESTRTLFEEYLTLKSTHSSVAAITDGGRKRTRWFFFATTSIILTPGTVTWRTDSHMLSHTPGIMSTNGRKEGI